MVNARRRTPVFQRGNALMVSLVFLVILTTLGVSAAGTGRLELMMAANTQYGNQAYQAAESGIDSVLRIDPDEILNAIAPQSAGPMTRTYSFNPTTSAEQAGTTTSYQTKVDSCTGKGNSLSTDEGGFASHMATIDSRSLSQRGGRAHHRQGFCFTAGPG